MAARGLLAGPRLGRSVQHGHGWARPGGVSVGAAQQPWPAGRTPPVRVTGNATGGLAPAALPAGPWRCPLHDKPLISLCMNCADRGDPNAQKVVTEPTDARGQRESRAEQHRETKILNHQRRRTSSSDPASQHTHELYCRFRDDKCATGDFV